MATRASDWTTNLQSSINNLWADFINVLPDIVGAIIVFVLGWIIASALGKGAQKLIERLKIDELADRLGVTDLFRQVNLQLRISVIIGWVIKWFLIIAFLTAAADTLGWTEVTEFLKSVALYIPNVIVAVIILTIGLLAAKFVEGVIIKGVTTTQLPETQVRTLATAGKVAIIVFAVLAALTQLGIAKELIQILFTGLVAALALAFGLGGKEKAAQFLEQFDRRNRPGSGM